MNTRELISEIITTYDKYVEVGYKKIDVMISKKHFNKDLQTHKTFIVDNDKYFLSTLIGKIEVTFEDGMIDDYYMEPDLSVSNVNEFIKIAESEGLFTIWQEDL